MKRLYFLAAFAVAILASPVLMRADEDDANSFGTRFSGEVDYEVVNGLHIHASEEIRLFGGSKFFDRSYSQVGVSYKICDFLKAGVSYTAIAVNKVSIVNPDTDPVTEQWTEWRHRFSGDVTASVKFGQFKLSLRERVQGTYKARELNNYQQPQTAWVLRSRLKASYEFRSVPLEPYVYFEPRLMLNGAKWGPESTGTDFAAAEFLGHKDVYINRYRAAAGLEWTLTRRSSIDFYFLFDHVYDKNIDARKEGSSKGVALKLPITDYSKNLLSVGVGYKFSF